MHERDHPYLRLHDSALANGGWATPSMAGACGLSESAFNRLVGTRGWWRVQRGVLAPPGVTLGWRQHLRIAEVVLGPPWAVTGDTALRLRSMRLDPQPPFQLVVPHERRVAALRPPLEIHRSGVLDFGEDVTIVQGVPVVSGAWPVAHLGRVRGRRDVLARTLSSIQQELFTWQDVDHVLGRAANSSGIAPLRWARDQVDGQHPDSILEHDARKLARSAGIAIDPAPFPQRTPAGWVAHLDVTISWAWAFWAVDGFADHGGQRRPFDRDRSRWSVLQRMGWRPGWITSTRLREDPGGIVEEMREVIEAADPERPRPRPARCNRPTCGACLAYFS